MVVLGREGRLEVCVGVCFGSNGVGLTGRGVWTSAAGGCAAGVGLAGVESFGREDKVGADCLGLAGACEADPDAVRIFGIADPGAVLLFGSEPPN